MFERFTQSAREVVTLAQREARAFNHGYIGTEHLLLGLMCEQAGLGARVLAESGITLRDVRPRVVEIVGAGTEEASGQIPFTPRAKRVMELSLREALALGHNYVGSSHLLLALIRENEGVGARILSDMGTDSERLRNDVVRMLSGPHRVDPPPEPSEPEPVNDLPGVERERCDSIRQAILDDLARAAVSEPLFGLVEQSEVVRNLAQAYESLGGRP